MSEQPRSFRLPASITPLIGREQALADAAATLLGRQLRLVHAPGPAGTGKTRTAVANAQEIRAAF